MMLDEEDEGEELSGVWPDELDVAVDTELGNPKGVLDFVASLEDWVEDDEVVDVRQL